MKSFSRFISIMFHPIFLPTYMTCLLALSLSKRFAQADIILLIVVLLTAFFPLFSLFLMKKLEMIDSYDLKSRKERFIPLISVATFWLMAYLFFDFRQVAPAVSNMMLGCVASIFIAFPLNSASKISFHTIGMGGLIGLFINIFPLAEINILPLFLVALLLSGLVGTARLQLKSHNLSEIFGGYLVGFFGQFFAFQLFDKLAEIFR